MYVSDSQFLEMRGLLHAKTNDISFLIEVEPHADFGYVLNENGFKVDVFYDIKNKNKLATLKTGNALIYVLAGIYKRI